MEKAGEASAFGYAVADVLLTETGMSGGSAAPDCRISLDQPLSQASAPLFVEHLRRGAKPSSSWMCGLEFELFGYEAESLARLDAGQVQSVMVQLAASSDNLHFEGGVMTEALGAAGERVTVEPGGQIEFSGAPRRSLAEIERDMEAFLKRLDQTAAASGFIFLATGFDPLRTMAEQRWFPKPRYEVMRPYLATRGRRAWDMMCRTCAIQANLDYGSEEDLAKKFILGNRLAPIVTAIFANSPFEHGAPSGYKSTRAAAWLETDDERALLSPLAFDDRFSFQRFVDHALGVPLIFTRRNGAYSSEATGQKFRAFLDRNGNGTQPIFQDWTDHLTTIFTEARLKQYVEVRSADCGQPSMALALAAFWKGLMYDAAALEEALRLAPRLAQREMRALQERVAREGLAASYAGVNVLNLAKETIKLAAAGLNRVAPEEARYLDALCEQVIEDEVCPADILLSNWHGSWHGSLDQLIKYLSVA
jgi:glutamate--cysteine ligase